MSRGTGKVLRAVLEVLCAPDVGLLDSITIAALVYGRNTVTVSEATSVRRALRSLAESGQVVDLGRGWRDGRRKWAIPANAAAYRERVERTFGSGAHPGALT